MVQRPFSVEGIEKKRTYVFTLPGAQNSIYDGPLSDFLKARGYFITQGELAGFDTRPQDLRTMTFERMVQSAMASCRADFRSLGRAVTQTYIVASSTGALVTAQMLADKNFVSECNVVGSYWLSPMLHPKSRLISLTEEFPAAARASWLTRWIPIPKSAYSKNDPRAAWIDPTAPQCHKTYSWVPLSSLMELERAARLSREILDKMLLPVSVMQGLNDYHSENLPTNYHPYWLRSLITLLRSAHNLLREMDRREVMTRILKDLERVEALAVV